MEVEDFEIAETGPDSSPGLSKVHLRFETLSVGGARFQRAWLRG